MVIEKAVVVLPLGWIEFPTLIVMGDKVAFRLGFNAVEKGIGARGDRLRATRLSGARFTLIFIGGSGGKVRVFYAFKRMSLSFITGHNADILAK